MLRSSISLLHLRTDWRKFSAILCALAVQNLIYFSLHYFYGYSFTGDSSKTYHAIPFCFIELHKLGQSSSWMPYAGFGYPLFLVLQSGFYYPPFWIFVLLEATYTFKAAIVLQGLHVLAGGVGAVLAARLLNLRWSTALLTGVLYQSFGGFYVNSMHTDIVRAYALAPWIAGPALAAWRLNHNPRVFGLMTAIQPIVVYMLWTGGYPGATIATLFCIGLIVAARTLVTKDRMAGIRLLAGYAAGTLLAGVLLVPALLHLRGLARVEGASITYDFVAVKDLWSLIFSTENSFFEHDATMRSLFIGVVPCAILLAGTRTLKRLTPATLLALLAALVASGVLHELLRRGLPQLGYSRFPYGDHRALMALPLILLAARTLETIWYYPHVEWRSWPIVFLLILLWGASMLSLPVTSTPFLYSLVAWLTVSIVLMLRARLGYPFCAILLCVIAGADWGRVHWKHTHFALENGLKYLEGGRMYQVDGPDFNQHAEIFRTSVRTPPAQRPRRLDIPEKSYVWRGYYSGEYTTSDWSGPMQFNRQRRISTTPYLKDFAMQAWIALEVPGEDVRSLQDWPKFLQPQQSPLGYEPSRLNFSISLSRPATVVENELYWEGWTAEAREKNTGEVRSLVAEDMDDFRAWRLPAGEWLVSEQYHTPNLRAGLITSILGVFLWGGLLVEMFLRRNRHISSAHVVS